MQRIPYEQWERREHCAFYNHVDVPFYSVGVDVKITEFVKRCKEEKHPFYYSFMYAVMYTINGLEDFRYRLHDDEVILHEKLTPSFTDMMEGTRLHKICKCPMEGNIREFVRVAKQVASEQKRFFLSKEEEARDDYVYITSLPWVSYKMSTNTTSFDKNDFIPRVAWGKYYEEKNELCLPVTLQVNHRAIDGIHVGEFFERLQCVIAQEVWE